jgi:serine/threonine protein kinase/tetratricopeptide (TPR) repeat protein
MIGKTISHYKILEKLGEGGMGVVYRAHDFKLDRDVALKFLPSNLTASSEELSRFEQEARAISALNHPHIATIYDVDEAEGQRYLVLECIPGGTLKTRLRQLRSEDREFPIPEVVTFGMQMAEGLAHAHRHGIIHRDVKTDNMMLTEEGKVKLTDFGLAKLRGTIPVTKTGSTLGTAAYMSPEQIRGEDADRRSDLFSLGIVLYELLTSRLPFRGEFEAALSYAILNEDPPPVKSLRPDVPDSLEKIIGRCLEKDREKRYSSAEDVLADLRKVAQEAPRQAETRGKLKRLPLFFGIGMTIVALAVLGVFFLFPKHVPSGEKSIAVLPFVDMSPQKDQEYFCDGMTEALINRLSQIQDLRVPARTSAFTFKGKTGNVREIGKTLNVQTVLEGSVQKSEERLRITAQLIHVKDGYHLWSETYDRELKDVFAIQDEISSAIVNTLRLKLSPGEIRKISGHPIDNVKAYDYFLKADRQAMRFDEKSLDSALVYLWTALDIMGDNAELYSALSGVFSQYANIGARQEDYLEKSEEYARKALSIKPDLSSALSRLASLAFYQEYPGNQHESFRYYKKALASNPNEIQSLHGMAQTYSEIGRYSDALPLIERLKRQDPLNPRCHIASGFIHLYGCHFEQALEQLSLHYHADPTSPMAQANYAGMLALNGKRDQALAVLDQIQKTDSKNVMIVFSLILKQALLNDREGALRLVTDDFRKTCWRDLEWSYWTAAYLSLAGAGKEALDWLENAVHRGFINYPYLQCDPLIDNIRQEERFTRLMEWAKNEWEHFEVPE